MNGAFIPRNAGEGPDFLTVNLRLSRTFRVRGPARLEALAEVFNLTNRENVVALNGNFGAGRLPDEPVADVRPGHGRRRAALVPARATLQLLMARRALAGSDSASASRVLGARGDRRGTAFAAPQRYGRRAADAWASRRAVNSNVSVAAGGIARRRDLGGAHPGAATDVYAAFSQDGGVSFGAPVARQRRAGRRPRVGRAGASRRRRGRRVRWPGSRARPVCRLVRTASATSGARAFTPAVNVHPDALDGRARVGLARRSPRRHRPRRLARRPRRRRAAAASAAPAAAAHVSGGARHAMRQDLFQAVLAARRNPRRGAGRDRRLLLLQDGGRRGPRRRRLRRLAPHLPAEPARHRRRAIRRRRPDVSDAGRASARTAGRSTAAPTTAPRSRSTRAASCTSPGPPGSPTATARGSSTATRRTAGGRSPRASASTTARAPRLIRSSRWRATACSWPGTRPPPAPRAASARERSMGDPKADAWTPQLQPASTLSARAPRRPTRRLRRATTPRRGLDGGGEDRIPDPRRRDWAARS